MLTGIAWANVYRCVSDDGTVRYSDQPCAGDAELYIEETVCDLEDSLRRSSPIPGLDMYSADVIDRLVANAKKLGKCILPNEPYVSYSADEHRLPGCNPTWDIDVYYGLMDGRAKWFLTFQYAVRTQDGFSRIWIQRIITRLSDLYHDPPSLKSVGVLDREGQGIYRVQGWYSRTD